MDGLLAYVGDDGPLTVLLGIGLSISAGNINAIPAWANITGKPAFATVATSGVYGDLTGKPAAFSISQPSARTLAVSTSYQAADNTKPAIIYPSFGCQNATTIIASSACTIQVRMGSSALNCATGTVYYTQSLAVTLGLLLTQTSTNPVPIFLPAGGYFIFCPTTGTFTITTVEQALG